MTTLAERVLAGASRFYRNVTGTGYAGRSSGKRAAAVLSGVAAVAAVAGLAHYTVKPGDTLSSIAQAQCHSAADWTGIYSASRHSLGSDPNLIYPGQKVTVHCATDASVLAAPAAPARASRPAVQDVARQPVRASSGDSDSDSISGDGGHAVTAAAPAHAPAAKGAAAPASGCYDPSGTLTDAQVAMVWTCAGGPSWAVPGAEAVSMCESGHNTQAYNPSGATGLFQILGQVVDFGRSLYDAVVNAANAVSKFQSSGNTWSAWVCQP
jgi:hypothetical protein